MSIPWGVAIALVLVTVTGSQLISAQVSAAPPATPCWQQEHVDRFLQALKGSDLRKRRAFIFQDAHPLYHLSGSHDPKPLARDRIDRGIPIDGNAVLRFVSAKGIHFRSVEPRLDVLVPRRVIQTSLRDRLNFYYWMLAHLRSYARQHSTLKCVARDGDVFIQLSGLPLGGDFFEISVSKSARRIHVTGIAFYGGIAG